MTDRRLHRPDPKGANRAAAPLRHAVEYVECAKCGRVVREDQFLAHLRTKHGIGGQP